MAVEVLFVGSVDVEDVNVLLLPLESSPNAKSSNPTDEELEIEAEATDAAPPASNENDPNPSSTGKDD